MSRAFVKEPDGETAGDDQPELPLSPHRNFVTPAGLAALEARQQALEAERQALKASSDPLAARAQLGRVGRELRYLAARLANAEPVAPGAQPQDEVAFGALVTLEGEAGARHSYRIVGEDEADPAAGKISWVSPLAKAMMGSRVGDLVTWRRPAGALELEVVAIRYDDS
jgi:transcription elongation GreA/GreB family factor